MTGTRSRRRIKSSVDCSARSRSRRSPPLEQSTKKGAARWTSTSVTLPVASQWNSTWTVLPRIVVSPIVMHDSSMSTKACRGVESAYERTKRRMSSEKRRAAASAMGRWLEIRWASAACFELGRSFFGAVPKRWSKTNRQQLVQADGIVRLVEAIGREITQHSPRDASRRGRRRAAKGCPRTG